MADYDLIEVLFDIKDELKRIADALEKKNDIEKNEEDEDDIWEK